MQEDSKPSVALPPPIPLIDLRLRSTCWCQTLIYSPGDPLQSFTDKCIELEKMLQTGYIFIIV